LQRDLRENVGSYVHDNLFKTNVLTSSAPRVRSLKSLASRGFHRVVWYEWGDATNPRVAICVHGLTRTGRDFDVVAEALGATHRVLAVDMPGRGRSEWLANKSDYAFPTYLTTLSALIAASGAEQVDWIGTSMGGLLGIAIAAQPNTPVRRLVVNDVGPAIEPAALERIRGYVGADPIFATYAAFSAYVRSISPFGALNDAQWEHLTRTIVGQRADGRFGFLYDPGIAEPFRATAAPGDLWALWDATRCPTLVLRGAESDLLSPDTARAMTARGPRPRLLEFAGVGHAPMLLDRAQIDPVVRFLNDG
jgi:pimeloyl-ACP methyl ester carboxylesterase